MLFSLCLCLTPVLLTCCAPLRLCCSSSVSSVYCSWRDMSSSGGGEFYLRPRRVLMLYYGGECSMLILCCAFDPVAWFPVCFSSLACVFDVCSELLMCCIPIQLCGFFVCFPLLIVTLYGCVWRVLLFVGWWRALLIV